MTDALQSSKDSEQAPAHDPFVAYYAEASASPATLQRFQSVFEMIGRVREEAGLPATSLDIADIGCGAGTQCFIWKRAGHRVHAIDINEPLVELGRRRAREQNLEIDFRVGSATSLPWADASVDVCLAPELLEHVAEWRACLSECMRILRPGGVLYVSTTNYLCPRQTEFELPFYSWYPAPLKRYFERRSVTDWPELVNHAKYPAVNWFSFYSLRRYLRPHGFDCRDRFQTVRMSGRSGPVAAVLRLLRALPPLRLLGQFLTAGSVVVAIRRPSR